MEKNENIELSVLIAVYNAEKYLADCLLSVLSQSIRKMEIIIVDDGSEDNSLKIAENYKKEYDNIKVIPKKHEGTLLTRLEGMRHARGAYIAFIDSDDTFEPYSLQSVLNIAVEKKVDILEFGYHLINQKKQEIFVYNMGHNGKIPQDVLIEGRKRCFNLLDSYELEACLCKRFYSKRLCKSVLNYFMGYADYKIRFKDMLVEDEFMTPLFFANARSYYYMKQKIYNYRFRNPGGTTHSMQENTDCMLSGAEEYMCACANISVELRKKQLVSKLEYYNYNIKGIDFFVRKSNECQGSSINRIRKIMKYYSLKDIICIYIGRLVHAWLF